MFELLIEIANKKHQGHFALMKFSGNWRCCFGTPEGDCRTNICQMAEGKTMDEAIKNAIVNEVNAYDFRDLSFEEVIN